MRSNTISTDCCRPPGGQDVLCGVDIPIVGHAAVTACPGSDLQRHRFSERTTLGAQLRRWKPPVDHDNFASVPRTLVLQHRPKFTPSRIRDCAGELPILHHVADRQVLDYERLVLTYEPSGQFVQMRAPTICDTCMDAGNLAASLVSICRGGRLSRQGSLRLDESRTMVGSVARVGDLLAARKCQQRIQSHVDPDFAADNRQRLNACVLAQQRDKPASRTILGHCHSGGFNSVGKWTRPHDVQRVGHFCEGQLAMLPSETTAGVLRCGTRPLARLESRIAGPFAPEPRESGLQVPEHLLQRYRRHVVEKTEFLGLLPSSKHRRRVAIGDPLTASFPRLGPRRQSQVVYLPNTSEGLGQLSCLLWRWIAAVPKCSLDSSGRHASESSTYVRTGSSFCVTHLSWPTPQRAFPGIVD